MEALKLWKKMVQSKVPPTTVTFISVLRACSAIGLPSCLTVGEAVHKLISPQLLKEVSIFNYRIVFFVL